MDAFEQMKMQHMHDVKQGLIYYQYSYCKLSLMVQMESSYHCCHDYVHDYYDAHENDYSASAYLYSCQSEDAWMKHRNEKTKNYCTLAAVAVAVVVAAEGVIVVAVAGEVDDKNGDERQAS